MQLTTKNLGHAALALALTAGLAAHADVSLGADEAGAKAIRVDDPESAPLRVVLEPTRDSFKVGEPIRFHVRGNKTFYLYLFSVDDDGDATLILPTKEGQRHNKYPADTKLPVPNEGAPDFLADEPGRETLVVVASAKYLRWKSNWFLDGAESYVDKAEFEKEFASKGIRVGAGKDADDDVVAKRISVRVRGEDDAGRERQTADVWLTTKGNRAEYAMGERIDAVFGAGENGWLQLYVIEPNGKYSRLKTYEVEKDKTYTMRAVAEDPVGKHAFVAVYTEDEPGAATLGRGADKSVLDATPKGVRVEEEAAGPMVVYRFRIEDD